jgi:RNA polymerase sigma-70 factor (ECF subfamily)
VASALDSDSALLERMRQGERQLFGELVRKYRPEIVRLARGYVPTDEEAEDLTQQTFIRALRAIAEFRGDASFRTWLHKICVNLAKNHARDGGRLRTVSLEEVELITNALGTGKMAVREARRKLAAAVERLPPKQRQVVELRLAHEMSFRAIAVIVSSTEDAAKANYQHAVKKLREWTTG